MSCFNEAAGIPRGRQRHLAIGETNQLASMRPRVFPAEDADDGGARTPEEVLASMRPRVFPAEDAGGDDQGRPEPHASMRPRVFPAEDRA